jgi:hypothetical protein
MKTASQYLIALVLAAIAGWFILFQIQSVKRVVDAIESIETSVRAIRETLAPVPMRATVVLPEESPKDIHL